MTKVYCNYKKDEIAARMLDTALNLHFEGGDGFSIIHLSAAAEEVLAGLIVNKTNGGDVATVQTAREKTIAALKEMHRAHGTERSEKQIGTYLNFVRNQTKHHNTKSDPTNINVCLELEVEMAINRAIESYTLYFGNPTEKMVRYYTSISYNQVFTARIRNE